MTSLCVAYLTSRSCAIVAELYELRLSSLCKFFRLHLNFPLVGRNILLFKMFSIYVLSLDALHSNGGKLKSDITNSGSLDMSTYLRHQSFNLQLSESATNAHSWAETEWHSNKRLRLSVLLRIGFYPPLWYEFVQRAEHQNGHRSGCL